MTREFIITRAQASKIAKGHAKTKDTPALTWTQQWSSSPPRIKRISIVPCAIFRDRQFTDSILRCSFCFGDHRLGDLVLHHSVPNNLCDDHHRLSSYCTLRTLNWKPTDHTRDVLLVADVAELIPGFLLSELHHAFPSTCSPSSVFCVELLAHVILQPFNMLPCLVRLSPSKMGSSSLSS